MKLINKFTFLVAIFLSIPISIINEYKSLYMQIDQENATELKDLRDQLSHTYKGKLMERERKLLNDLKAEG